MKKITIFLSFLFMALAGQAQEVSYEEQTSKVVIKKEEEVETDTVWTVIDGILEKCLMVRQKYVIVYHPTDKELEGLHLFSPPSFYKGERKVQLDMFHTLAPTLSVSLAEKCRLYYDNFYKNFLIQN